MWEYAWKELINPKVINGIKNSFSTLNSDLMQAQKYFTITLPLPEKDLELLFILVLR